MACKACCQHCLHYIICTDISCHTVLCVAASVLSLQPPAVGSQFTGTAINPARALGPAVVFHCRWDRVWLYVIAGLSTQHDWPASLLTCHPVSQPDMAESIVHHHVVFNRLISEVVHRQLAKSTLTALHAHFRCDRLSQRPQRHTLVLYLLQVAASNSLCLPAYNNALTLSNSYAAVCPFCESCTLRC